MTDEDEEKIGYCKPPKKHQFQKGMSGNPTGRPRKVAPDNDLKSMLDRVGNEEVEIGGRRMTMQEVALTALQRKAAKGDVAANRHLAKMRAEVGIGQIQPIGGVMVVPGTRPLQEWTAAAALQQEGFRTKKPDEGSG